MQNSLPAFLWECSGNAFTLCHDWARKCRFAAWQGWGGGKKKKATTPKRLPGEASLGSDSFLPEQAGRKF